MTHPPPGETFQREGQWELVTSQRPTPSLYLANGYLGAAIPWDGGFLPESRPANWYMRGLYRPAPKDGIDRLAVLPPLLDVRYSRPAAISGYERRVDMRGSELRTALWLHEARGALRLEQRVILSRSDPHLCLVDLAIVPEFDGELALRIGLDVGSSDLTARDWESDGDTLLVRGTTPVYGVETAISLSYDAPGWQMSDEWDRGPCWSRTLTAAGRSGREVRIVQQCAIATTLEARNPAIAVRRTPSQVVSHVASHHAAWERLWETDIEIVGDDEVQEFVRAALFYLWSSVRAGDRWSIPPMGLSSNFYNGHIFWDAELWMFPSLLVTQPELALACVSYRHATLAAARERAASNGCAGAQFPWEGGFTGTEMTPSWAETRDYQLHITADVAIAQWWYYLNTLDIDWLRAHGFPVIRQCADYWASRVEWNDERSRFEISDVVCADEYAEHVNNDAFTNAAVRQALLIAGRAAELLDEPASLDWRRVAEAMYIPYDGERGVHLEFDGFEWQTTKQADVELLAYPLEHVTDHEQVALDLDAYAVVIDPNGPAMSFSVYSILSAQLGRVEDAYVYFRRAFRPNADPPFWSFSETPTNGEAMFCTGIGGALQALLFGFTGLRLREGYFTLRPCLPPQWEALRLRNLFIAGARTDIEIEPDRTRIRRRGGPPVALDIDTGDVESPAVVVIEGPERLSVAFATPEGEILALVPSPSRVPIPIPRRSNGLRLRLVDAESVLLDVHLMPAAGRVDARGETPAR